MHQQSKQAVPAREVLVFVVEGFPLTGVPIDRALH